MNKLLFYVLWTVIAIMGATAIGGIALNRGENINALWFIAAALCVYAIAYRFYAAWIAATVLVVDQTRATPAERLDNGRDFVPTNKWIVFWSSFCRDCRTRTISWTDAGRAVRLFAGHLMDIVRGGVGRLCPGYGHSVPVYPT